jgi:hypothetical protein
MEQNNAILQSINLIESEIARLQQVVRLLKNEVPIVGNMSAVSHSRTHVTAVLTDANAYNPSASWVEKFNLFLRINRRFVHIREVVEWIMKMESLPEKQTNTVTARLTAALNPLKVAKEIVKFEASKGDNMRVYWGSPKWLDNGKIIAGHEFDPTYPKQRAKNIGYKLDL